MYNNIHDNLMFGDNTNHGLWVKTDISAYTGYKTDPLTGKSSWDEVLFEHEENMVTISGVQFAMESIFGIKGGLTIPTLKSAINAGPDDVVYNSASFQTPNGQVTSGYPLGYRVCLFGLGISGTAENTITKYPINYREQGLQMNKTADDGTNLNGIMVPFRYSKTALNPADQRKYFGKKTEAGGYTGYYLKTFDTEPVVKHVWKATAQQDESEIQQEHVWDLTRKSPVETYTQITLRINEKDVKEWVEATSSVAEAKFNTLGLFTGFYNSSKGDFEDVKLFSKLYVPTESLALNKDITYIYKVYGA